MQTTHAEKGPEAAREVVQALKVKGETNSAIRDSARRAPYWLVIELQEKAKPEEVEAALSAGGPLVKGEVDEKQILRDVYDHWAGAFLDKGYYRGAFGVYVRALTGCRTTRSCGPTWRTWSTAGSAWLRRPTARTR